MVECLDDEHGIVPWDGEDYFALILEDYRGKLSSAPPGASSSPPRTSSLSAQIGCASTSAWPPEASPGLAVIIGVRRLFIASGKSPKQMKSSTQLIEAIIRAKTALHLRLAADLNSGKVEVGGRRIDDLIAEVDAGIASYEQILVLFKNEDAAAVMIAAAQIDAEEDWKAPAEPASVTSRAEVGPEQGKPRDGKS